MIAPVGRSTSPRAVERRRLQNRLSQRTHRQKVRESLQQNRERKRQQAPSNPANSSLSESRVTVQEASSYENPITHGGQIQHTPEFSRDSQGKKSISAGSTSELDTPTATSFRPDSPSNATLANWMMDRFFMPRDDVLPHQSTFWPNMDSMPNESRMSQPRFPPATCFCSGTTGPCPSHLEQMRAQVLAEMTVTSPRPLHRQHPLHEVPNADSSISKPFPQTPVSSEFSPQPLRAPHASSVIRNSSSDVRNDHISPPEANSPAALPAAQSESWSTESNPTAFGASTVDITRRFDVVLEAMRTIGCQDFDAMVITYYTAQFEKDSFAAMVQGASRSRRLKTMLEKLHESSAQWPRWESRGLQESTSDATASVCIDEMERLIKLKPPGRGQIDPASLITAFEGLLLHHERSIHGDYRSHSSIPDELKLWRQMEAAPDSMPYLWSVLTKLVGTQGLYCDRIARIVLGILFRVRDK